MIKKNKKLKKKTTSMTEENKTITFKGEDELDIEDQQECLQIIYNALSSENLRKLADKQEVEEDLNQQLEKAKTFGFL